MIPVPEPRYGETAGASGPGILTFLQLRQLWPDEAVVLAERISRARDGDETDERNLWPEAGPIPNRKDALERYVRNRICVKATMRVRTAVRIFLADWVTYSRRDGL